MAFAVGVLWWLSRYKRTLIGLLGWAPVVIEVVGGGEISLREVVWRDKGNLAADIEFCAGWPVGRLGSSVTKDFRPPPKVEYLGLPSPSD